jgi:hypothetical protein
LIDLFRPKKQLSAKATDNELVAVFGHEVKAYSTDTKYQRRCDLKPIHSYPPTLLAMEVVNNAIFDAIEKQQFSSFRELAQLTCISRSTIHLHLTQSLGYVMKHLKWFPHSLYETQKIQRVNLSIELLDELRSIKHHGWKYIITLDESRFYIAIDHEQIWLRPEEAPPEKPNRMIQDRKVIVTIAWYPLGFHLIEALPKGWLFN